MSRTSRAAVTWPIQSYTGPARADETVTLTKKSAEVSYNELCNTARTNADLVKQPIVGSRAEAGAVFGA